MSEMVQASTKFTTEHEYEVMLSIKWCLFPLSLNDT